MINFLVLLSMFVVPLLIVNSYSKWYHKRKQDQTPEGKCPNCWMKTGYRIPLLRDEVGTLFELGNGDIMCSNHWDGPDYRIMGNRKCLYYKRLDI
jgi:hypothetical protein